MEELGIVAIMSIIYFASFITWIWQIIRLSSKKNKHQMWLILVLGILLCMMLPIVTLISLFLGRGKENDAERERERTEFTCGICHVKYREDLYLGGETIREGKICRYCLEKRQREKEE